MKLGKREGRVFKNLKGDDCVSFFLLSGDTRNISLFGINEIFFFDLKKDFL